MKLRAYITALHAALFLILLAVTPASSGSMTLLGVGKPAAAGGGIVFTPTDAQSATPGFASGSITLNIGTASADRIVVVGIVSDSSALGVPVIGGVTGTKAAGASDTTAHACGLWYANVPTGTTAAVTFGAGASGVSMVAGYLTGQSGGGGAASANPVTYTAGGAQPLTVSLTVPAGGRGIAVGGYGFGAGGSAFTWTGTTAGGGDESAFGANSTIGMAHSTSTGTVGVQTNPTVLSSGGTMAAASWAP